MQHLQCQINRNYSLQRLQCRINLGTDTIIWATTLRFRVIGMICLHKCVQCKRTALPLRFSNSCVRPSMDRAQTQKPAPPIWVNQYGCLWLRAGLYFKAICNRLRCSGHNVFGAESPQTLQNVTPDGDITRDWNVTPLVQSRSNRVN